MVSSRRRRAIYTRIQRERRYGVQLPVIGNKILGYNLFIYRRICYQAVQFGTGWKATKVNWCVTWHTGPVRLTLLLHQAEGCRGEQSPGNLSYERCNEFYFINTSLLVQFNPENMCTVNIYILNIALESALLVCVVRHKSTLMLF